MPRRAPVPRTRPRARRAWLAAVALTLATAGCAPDGGGPSGAPRPDRTVVVVSLDTLRSDRVGAYGHAGAETPNLDAFASEATVFDRAYAQYPMTLPSHASIFTGRLPPRHGVRHNVEFALPETAVTLAETLHDAGYATAGAVSTMVLRRGTGIEQGFEWFDDEMPAVDEDSMRRFPERRGDDTLDAVESFLDDRRTAADDRPLFLFVHLFDPHAPYDAPPPFGDRIEDAYDAEVAWTDSLVGRLFERLREDGLYDDAWIVVLSDHGEGLGDHVEREHGFLLYRETIQTVLMIRQPGGRDAGRRVDAPVGLVDVHATVLAALGLPPASETDGIDLRDEDARRGRRGVYSETLAGEIQFGWSPLRSVVQGPWHYIDGPAPELYDVVADPREDEDLAGAEAPLPSMLDVLEEVGEGRRSTAAISEAERDRLASLGYVGGSAPARAAGRGANPRDRIGEFVDLFDWVDRLGDGPGLEPEERVLALQRGLGMDNEAITRAVAQNVLRAGDADRAWRLLEPFHDSPAPATMDTLGRIRAEMGDGRGAAVWFRRLTETYPDDARGPTGLGVTLLSDGRPGEALRWLERAVDLDPDAAEAWNGIAVIRASGNDLVGAIDAWEQAVAADPDLSDAWYNLAVVHERLGHTAEAREAMGRYRRLTGG